MTDPISNMLTSIKNAQAVGREEVKVSYSEIKFNIAKILQKEKYVGEVAKKGKIPRKFITITLRYDDNKSPLVTGIRRFSKPSRRFYLKKKEIKPFKQGFGARIISTSKGLMADKEAFKAGLGGEVICEIW